MPKFVAKKPEKEVISLRLAAETLKKIDEKAAAAEISRNELICQMVDFALQCMDEPDNE